MSFKEFIADPKSWIGIVGGLFGTAFAYVMGRRKSKVETDKTEVEKNRLQFTFKTEMEEHYDSEIRELKKRIDELEKRDEEKDEIIKKLSKQILEQNETIEQLKSEKNFNNTINR